MSAVAAGFEFGNRDRQMRIGIDTRLWGEPRSGIGRYTRSLVEAQVRLAPEVRWILYLDRPPGDLPPGTEPRWLPWRSRLLWTLWAVRRDLGRRPIDLFHGVTGFELPSGGCRLVTTVHDLIPLRFPHLVPARHRWAVRILLGGALRRATRVIAVSEATRAEILARYRTAPDKIAVVPEAAAPHFRPPPAADTARVRERLGLGTPYILFVGLLEPKKNLPTLLAAVARLRAAGAWGTTRLCLAGAPGWGVDGLGAAVARHGLGDTVRFLGAVPEVELPALYAGATAFVFPSLWEGFGLPVLEAMAVGTPVIASRRGALPEITGGAALLVEPEAAALADALGTLLADSALRARLGEAGLARAQTFSWERTARETLAVYRAALA
ncbi:MAG TPA: glycosyltransferase family 1 protein [Methylomirabilota bacterium]|jgi:glycosyltransferase involved in cell wall biosynthesis|nr:glycosyltransferase family 1 protein [Methylomirabilota bacterium]